MIQGIKAYFNALGIISRLRLWKYFAIPMLMSVLLAIVIGSLAYGFSDNIGGVIASIWPWESGKVVFSNVSTFLGGLIVIALGALVFKHLILALSAPFMGPISQKIETYLTGNERPARPASSLELLVRGFRISLRNLTRELLLTIPILLLVFIPVIGVSSALLLFLMQAYYAGFGNIDYTLERHFNFKDSVQFVRKNRGLALGNGIVFMAFLLIPIIGIMLVLPLSVTAATVETVKKLHQDQL
jgi:CysZ protein